MDAPIEASLRAVEQRLRKKQPPTRFEARPLLVAIGLAHLEERAQDAAPALAKLRAWIEADPAGWGRAIADEVAAATAEHVHSADPRWLAHEKYDFPYVVEARHRLEARLVAAEQLGIDVADDVLEAIARADGILQPFLEARRPSAEDADRA